MKKALILFCLLFVLSPNAYALLDRYGYRYCNSSDYSCITVKPGETWASLFPSPQKRDAVMRLNRMNIPLKSGMRLAVPRYARNGYYQIQNPMPAAIRPIGTKSVIVSVGQLAWGAYSADGRLVGWGPISAGQSWCSDINRDCGTIYGTFTFTHKRGDGCVSSAFPVGEGGSPMPYCMFFHQGYALHGSYGVPGFNASHGCVRMFVNDARWLNEHFVDLPGSGRSPTKVIVQR